MDPPVARVRILGRCTAELATADQSADNQKLKRLTRQVLRELRLDERLRGEATEFGGLTRDARGYVGQVLSEVKRRFNGSVATKDLAKTVHAKRARHAFNHTLLCWLPGNKPNNRLAKLSVVMAWH